MVLCMSTSNAAAQDPQEAGEQHNIVHTIIDVVQYSTPLGRRFVIINVWLIGHPLQSVPRPYRM